MIKNASKLWGYQDTEQESSFDPIVGMLLEALAGELSKISGEISSTESRVVERLVELLTPEPMTGPVPSHSIVSAKPAESIFTIHPDYLLYLKKKYLIAGKNVPDEKQVFFTPAGNYRLFNGRVKYLSVRTKIFEITENYYKEIIAQAISKKALASNEIWVGIELHEDIESIKGLSFCFDLKNELYQDSFYYALTRGKWSVNGHPVTISPGFGSENFSERLASGNFLSQDSDTTTKICSHVNRFYANNFITFDGDDLKLSDLIWTEHFPPLFGETFNTKDTEKIDKGLFWVKAEVPMVLPAETIDDLFCAINCFPVINRRLVEFTQSSGEATTVIPLVSDDIFLDIKKVSGSKGSVYSAKSVASGNGSEEGTYLMRRGGIGRFDSRNAAEIISYLIELLRDEMAAFSILGTDMISSNLKELSQIIARLEQRLHDSRIVKEDTSYLMLNPLPGDDILFIEFWTTNGTFANKIKSGERLSVYEGSDLIPESIMLFTSTTGGKDRMSTEERINSYRKALLSHSRVVTPEDIKALCFEHFGKILQKVEVRKGVKTGQTTDGGFIRTLDIILTLAKLPDKLDPEELEFLKKELLIKLEEQSTGILPYRLIINKD